MTGINDFRNHPEPHPPRCKCGHYHQDHAPAGECKFKPNWCGCLGYAGDREWTAEDRAALECAAPAPPSSFPALSPRDAKFVESLRDRLPLGAYGRLRSLISRLSSVQTTTLSEGVSHFGAARSSTSGDSTR